MRAAVLDVNVYLDFARTRALGRGGSPEPPKAIAVNRPYLLRHMRIIYSIDLICRFRF
jgi:hypothetical protein